MGCVWVVKLKGRRKIRNRVKGIEVAKTGLNGGSGIDGDKGVGLDTS